MWNHLRLRQRIGCVRYCLVIDVVLDSQKREDGFGRLEMDDEANSLGRTDRYARMLLLEVERAGYIIRHPTEDWTYRPNYEVFETGPWLNEQITRTRKEPNQARDLHTVAPGAEHEEKTETDTGQQRETDSVLGGARDHVSGDRSTSTERRDDSAGERSDSQVLPDRSGGSSERATAFSAAAARSGSGVHALRVGHVAGTGEDDVAGDEECPTCQGTGVVRKMLSDRGGSEIDFRNGAGSGNPLPLPEIEIRPRETYCPWKWVCPHLSNELPPDKKLIRIEKQERAEETATGIPRPLASSCENIRPENAEPLPAEVALLDEWIKGKAWSRLDDRRLLNDEQNRDVIMELRRHGISVLEFVTHYWRTPISPGRETIVGLLFSLIRRMPPKPISPENPRADRLTRVSDIRPIFDPGKG